MTFGYDLLFRSGSLVQLNLSGPDDLQCAGPLEVADQVWRRLAPRHLQMVRTLPRRYRLLVGNEPFAAAVNGWKPTFFATNVWYCLA